MSEIISRKVWIKIDREELENIVRSSMDKPPAAFEVVKIEPNFDGHLVDCVVLELRIVEADADGSGDHLDPEGRGRE